MFRHEYSNRWQVHKDYLYYTVRRVICSYSLMRPT
jgi:hypothetical protein